MRTLYEFLTSDAGRNILASVAALITICGFAYRMYMRMLRRRAPRSVDPESTSGPTAPGSTSEGIGLTLLASCTFIVPFFLAEAVFGFARLQAIIAGGIVSAVCFVLWTLYVLIYDLPRGDNRRN